MFIPKPNVIGDDSELRASIDQHPFAILTRNSSHGPVIAHAPLLYVEEDSKPYLIGHIAKANPFFNDQASTDCVAVFTGPDGYISPNYYPDKQARPKLVPTWNYQRIEVRGDLQFTTDPNIIKDYVRHLTDKMETGQREPWKLEDAPEDYTQMLLKAIVGVRIEITQIEGTAKLSQDKPTVDQEAIISALSKNGDGALAKLMQSTTRNRS